MRLIISLIILILSICNIVKSDIANLYVNLVAYNDVNCKGTPSFGYGYSSAVNTCTTFDNENDFMFSVNNNIVSYSSFSNKDTGFDQTCTGTPETESTFKVNSCVSSKSIILNSSNKLSTGLPFYYKISTSSIPYAPSGTYTNSFMGGICENDNIVALQYYVNGTGLINTSNQKVTRFCDDGIAYDYMCSSGGKCKKSIATFPCYVIPPFYNSTDSSYSSACSFACCSGSCSGTSGTQSDTTSGTGEGWADIIVKNTDKLNNNKKFGSGSSNGGLYFSSRYCS